MQKYTLTVLVNEKVSEADRNAAFDEIKKSFSNLVKEDLWGVRSLSYDIKHMNKAFYAYFEFEAEPTAIITLDKNIRLNEDIIRYLIVKKDDKRVKVRKTKTEEKKEEVESEAVSEAPAKAVEKEKKARTKK